MDAVVAVKKINGEKIDLNKISAVQQGSTWTVREKFDGFFELHTVELNNEECTVSTLQIDAGREAIPQG